MKFIVLLSALMAVTVCLKVIPPFRSASNINPDGSFSFGYDTGLFKESSSHDAAGNADRVQGNFTFVSPESQRVVLSYVADERGFQAQGSHIPVGPEIPEHVLRALEWNRNHPEEEEKPKH